MKKGGAGGEGLEGWRGIRSVEFEECRDMWSGREIRSKIECLVKRCS